jgi:chromosome segregation ATPase
MRDDFEERQSINPLKIGLIGAILIAVVVAGLLQYRSYLQRKESDAETLAVRQKEIHGLTVENRDLKDRLDDLEKKSKDAQDRLQKQVRQRDSQLSSLRRQMDSDRKEASGRLTEANKEKSSLESELAKLKKNAEQQAQDAKKMRDQMAKLQADLQDLRDNNKQLKTKIDNIEKGEASAADQMVQQLAEARRQLKKEKAERERLEQELAQLRGNTSPPQ